MKISRKPKPPKRRQLWLSVFLVVLPILVIITCIYVQAINKDKYLVIREWGVRFELPKSIRGKVAYKMMHDGKESGFVLFYGLELAKQTESCQADQLKELPGLRLTLGRTPHNKLHNKLPARLTKPIVINGMKYGQVTTLGGYDYWVNFRDFPSADTPEAQRLSIAKKLPIGCYQASFPDKPDPKDPIWQESKTIYRALQPATYTLEKIPQ